MLAIFVILMWLIIQKTVMDVHKSFIVCALLSTNYLSVSETLLIFGFCLLFVLSRFSNCKQWGDAIWLVTSWGDF